MCKMLTKILVLSVAITTCLAVDRPCALTNYQCIGQVLARYSRCNPSVGGSIPTSYTVSQLPAQVPFFNASITDVNLIVTNHHRCVVTDFYLTYDTQTVLLSMECNLLSFESDRIWFQHRTLGEDLVYRYPIRESYPRVRLTINLVYNNGLNLCTAFTFADVVTLPSFQVNPGNPQSAIYLSTDATTRRIFARESMYWRARLLTRYFINSYLCNFECNF